MKKCPHDIVKKFCRICSKDKLCFHDIFPIHCSICKNFKVKKHCNCKKNKLNCEICKYNVRCMHKRKRARCFQCRHPEDKLCKLTDYQKNYYENELCDCKECINSEAIRQGKICFICRKKETKIVARCEDCFKVFQKNTQSETIITNIINHKIDYTNIKKPSELIEKYYKDSNMKRVEFITNKITNIYQYVQSGIQKYQLEKLLEDLLKGICPVTNRYYYKIQLSIGAYYLEKINYIFEKCDSPQSEYLMLRIIWYILNKNPSVMREIIESTNILSKIKSRIQYYNSDLELIIRQIVSHLETHGFTYKNLLYFIAIKIYKNTP